MEPTDMFAVIVAGVIVAGGDLCISYALSVIGGFIMILGAIYISRVKGVIS